MFFHEMLIAIDDSAPSQYAIDVGLVVAQLDGCPVNFCVVLDPALLEQGSGFLSMCELAEQLANQLLASALKRAADAGVTAKSTVLYRNPSQGIIDAAHREKADVIVMGTHGRSGVARAFTRSIAEEVLRRTSTPLFVVRRPKIGRVTHRILVPVVDDELSRVAFEYATSLAKSFDSSLFVFTACDALPGRDVRQFLNSVEEHAASHGVAAEGFIAQRARNIPEQIVQNARAMECDVIVMASHGRDGFMRFVEGSVAEGTIRASEIPVLVLRPASRHALV